MRAEQVLPALRQMTEYLGFVRQHFVDTAIQAVLLHQRIARAQQIAHRAVLKPQPVKPPLAAWIDQTVTDQRLQDVPPTGAFATVGQTCRPELIEAELLVQLAREPARAPLPR